MFGKLIHFIKYNNAFTLALGVVFFATGGVFAAVNPEAIIQAEDALVAIDNNYLLNLDMGAFTPTAQVTGVMEDDENYYVSYTLSTVDLADGVWKEVSKEKTLTVSTRGLGSRDLGLYVAEELGEVTDRERNYLARVQKIESAGGVTQKIVSTTYRGLIGQFLDIDEKVFPHYEPIEKPKPPAPPAPVEVQVAALIQSIPPVEQAPEPAPEPEPTPPPAPTPAQTQDATPAPAPTPDTTAPVITLNGASETTLNIADTYAELGATALDDVRGIVAIVITGAVDTAAVGDYAITYTATDTAGNIATTTRTVHVTAPAVPKPPPDGAQSASTTIESIISETATTTVPSSQSIEPGIQSATSSEPVALPAAEIATTTPLVTVTEPPLDTAATTTMP